MFPYHDDNRTKRASVMMLLLLFLNILVWLLVQGAGSDYAVAKSICELGLIPGELTGLVAPGSSFPMGDGMACVTDPGMQVGNLFTSMFLHGSWFHLIGNMWFLWLFGNNVEDTMSHGRFLLFYLVCGLAAALLQVAVAPASFIPMVGASGAISGIMGAYLVLFPKVHIYVLVPLGFYPLTFKMRAWTMLLYWLALQFLGGAVGAMGEGQGGVAFWAHVGGFLAGMALVKLFVVRDHLVEHQLRHWEPHNVKDLE